MPPQTNAVLSAVALATSAESYEGPQTAGTSVWRGTAAVYVQDKRRNVSAAEGADVLLDTFVIVDQAAPAVDWRVGHLLTFTRSGASAETRKVETVERAAIDDDEIPAELKTIRLGLEPV